MLYFTISFYLLIVHVLAAFSDKQRHKNFFIFSLLFFSCTSSKYLTIKMTLLTSCFVLYSDSRIQMMMTWFDRFGWLLSLHNILYSSPPFTFRFIKHSREPFFISLLFLTLTVHNWVSTAFLSSLVSRCCIRFLSTSHQYRVYVCLW